MITLAPSSTCHHWSLITPPSRAARPSTNENSPTCASAMPAAIATRSGARVSSSAPVASDPLTIMIAAAMAMTMGSTGSIARTSMSMPTETKKRLASRSRSGRTSAWIWWLNSPSARIRPPRNAPAASDNPPAAASTAVPTLASSTDSRNASREIAEAIRRTHGSRKRPISSTPPPTRASRTSAAGALSSLACSAPKSVGAIASTAMTTRSCSSRMPIVSRPCGAWAWLRAASSLSTTAVLDSVMNNPITPARVIVPPAVNRITAAATSTVMPTCPAAPARSCARCGAPPRSRIPVRR